MKTLICRFWNKICHRSGTYFSALLQVATRTFWGHAKAPSYAIIAFSRLISSNAIANEPFAAQQFPPQVSMTSFVEHSEAQ